MSETLRKILAKLEASGSGSLGFSFEDGEWQTSATWLDGDAYAEKQVAGWGEDALKEILEEMEKEGV